MKYFLEFQNSYNSHFDSGVKGRFEFSTCIGCKPADYSIHFQDFFLCSLSFTHMYTHTQKVIFLFGSIMQSKHLPFLHYNALYIARLWERMDRRDSDLVSLVSYFLRECVCASSPFPSLYTFWVLFSFLLYPCSVIMHSTTRRSRLSLPVESGTFGWALIGLFRSSHAACLFAITISFPFLPLRRFSLIGKGAQLTLS